jgi:hypothetical protein
MENPAAESDHKSFKRKAKRLYQEIGYVWCPALNDHIIFNNAGFRHLIWKGKKRRSMRDQKRRFFLLKYAENIIEDPNIEILHKKDFSVNQSKRHGRKNLSMSRADFWTLTKKYNDTIITIIIRRRKTGSKHFFSIYNESAKHQKTAT